MSNFQSVSSEKIILSTIDSVREAKVFTASGLNWIRTVEYFVIGLRDGSTNLTSGVDYTFSPTTMTLIILGGANPKTRNLFIIYRHFFANSPTILPYDLNTGVDVEWDGRLLSIGAIGQQLDDENTGIVLESNSNIELVNSDGHFDFIFDTHIFENQEVKFYSWIYGTPLSEKLLIFDGVVESKSFSESRVGFRVKDFIYKLSQKINSGLFSSTDGDILPSLIGTSKRRIYGKADNVECVSLDAILDGYDGTGLITGTVGGTAIDGDGSAIFRTELSPGDKIIVTIGEDDVEIIISEITQDFQATSDKPLTVSFTNAAFRIKPERPYRGRNRNWHIAGHKLTAVSKAITSVTSSTMFEVTDASVFFPDDPVLINGIKTEIRRISGNTITVKTAISPVPVITDTVERFPVKHAYIGSNRLTYIDDYTVTNTTEAKITLTTTAEFNITPIKKTSTLCTFTDNSITVTSTATVDFRSFLKSGDWIRIDDVNYPEWYELLQVVEQGFVTRVPINIAVASLTDGFEYKNVTIVDENSLITVDCYGHGDTSYWTRNGSDVVKHLIEYDAGLTVNASSFTTVGADMSATISLVEPESLRSDPPTIRDVINKINKSTFSAVYKNDAQEVCYTTLNSNIDLSYLEVKDDDIINSTIRTNQKIINQSIINYSHYTDKFNGNRAFRSKSVTLTFVNKTSGIEKTKTTVAEIYEESDAEIMANRVGLYNSLTQSVVELNGKLNLAHLLIGDTVLLNLDRVYSRYGSDIRKKLCKVVGVRNQGLNCSIVLSDIGGVLNMVNAIASNTQADFTSASDAEKMLYCFIVDNDTKTPDSTTEECLGSNIIG